MAQLCLIEMLAAFWFAHRHKPINGPGGGELALLFGVAWLCLAIAGGGAWSLDRSLRRRE